MTAPPGVAPPWSNRWLGPLARGELMNVDEDLLKILACPADFAPVVREGDRIVCTSCGRRYPIRDDIPIMLVEEAEEPR